MRVVYIVSNINKALFFEYIFDFLNDKLDIIFIFLGPEYPETGRFISKKNGCVHFIKLNGKKGYPIVGIKLYKLLNKLKPDIIYTHLRDADILGLSIAKFLGVKKRITTRHSATFNQMYHPKSVKIDKQINRWATDIVAISKNVRAVLIDEEVPESKITLIHHGSDYYNSIHCNNFSEQQLIDQFYRDIQWFRNNNITHNVIYTGGWWFLNKTLVKLLLDNHFKYDFSFSFSKYFYNQFSMEIFKANNIEPGQLFYLEYNNRRILCIQNLIGAHDSPFPQNFIRNIKYLFNNDDGNLIKHGVVNSHDYDLNLEYTLNCIDFLVTNNESKFISFKDHERFINHTNKISVAI